VVRNSTDYGVVRSTTECKYEATVSYIAKIAKCIGAKKMFVLGRAKRRYARCRKLVIKAFIQREGGSVCSLCEENASVDQEMGSLVDVDWLTCQPSLPRHLTVCHQASWWSRGTVTWCCHVLVIREHEITSQTFVSCRRFVKSLPHNRELYAIMATSCMYVRLSICSYTHRALPMTTYRLSDGAYRLTRTVSI